MQEQVMTRWSWRLFLLPLLSVAILLLPPSPDNCLAAEQLLVTAGPSWTGFTNKDGQGLYHDIIRLIFSPEYTIKHVYTETDQANAMVASGRADIKMCETGPLPDLLLGKYPMYENAYYAVSLRKSDFAARGKEALKGRLVAWREGYYSQADFPVRVIPQPVSSGEAALMMLSLERVDFYVDDMALINQSFAETKKELNRDDFTIQEVGKRKYYPVFTDNPRGHLLKDIYDAGIERLYRTGQLQPLYGRWHFPVPEFHIPK